MLDLSESDITASWDLNGPLASICCITYKQAEFIEQTLDSLLSQKTSFQFEIVVSDDCSNDGTDLILNSYKAKYPNIINIVTSSNNVGANRNLWRVLNAAKGEFIACCEGDDYWCDNDKLQLQVDFLVSNPEYALHVFDCLEEVNGLVDSKSSKLNRLGIHPGEYSANDLRSKFCVLLVSACFKNVGQFSYPRYFDKSISGDTLLSLLLSNYGKGYVDGSRKTAIYRIFDGGVWSKMSAEHKFYESMHTNLVHSRFLLENSQKEKSDLKLFSILFNTLKRVGVLNFIHYSLSRILKNVFNRLSGN